MSRETQAAVPTTHRRFTLQAIRATADILESCGILADDGLIAHFGDSHICGLDKHRPRVEITITPLPPEHPLYTILHKELQLGERGLRKKQKKEEERAHKKGARRRPCLGRAN
jgi:hypothetical protein